MAKWLLQEYANETYGYLDIDGDKNANFKTHSRVIAQQGENESREDFIAKNNLYFSKGEYGSNLKLDQEINEIDPEERRKVAEQGYGLKILINDEDPDVRAEVANQGYGLNKLINDKSSTVRVAVANQGHGLKELSTDSSSAVRSAVAKQGYGLDKLIDDNATNVREMVAKQRYRLDILMRDRSEQVRREVAKQYYGLDKLIKDENWIVRLEVARQGYGLDILINDVDKAVRNAVFEYIENYPINDETMHKIIDILLEQNRYEIKLLGDNIARKILKSKYRTTDVLNKILSESFENKQQLKNYVDRLLK